MAANKIPRNKADAMVGELRQLQEDAENAFEGRRMYFTARMAMYRGLQWGQSSVYGWMGNTADDEQQVVMNVIRPTVRAAVSDRLKSLLNAVSVPAHSDHDSMVKALASYQLMRSFPRTKVFPFLENWRGCLAAAVHGAAWFKTTWDPAAGDFVSTQNVNPETGEVQTTIDRAGDIRVRFKDVYDILPDPWARCEEDVMFIFQRTTLPAKRAEDMFPEDAWGGPTRGRFETPETRLGQQERDAIEDPAVGGNMYGAATMASSNDLVEVMEYWERPTGEFPRGRHVVYSGGLVLSIGPMPVDWPWDLLLGDNIQPNGLYADGAVQDLIEPQRTLNLNESKRKEWMDKVLSPPLLNPFGSGIAPDQYSDLAGEVIGYNMGHKPEWMQVPDIPQSMSNYTEALIQRIREISTYADIDATANLDSGRALAYHDEIKSGVRMPDRAHYNQVIISILKKCLVLAHDWYEEGRMVNVMGENQKWLVQPFKASNFDPFIELIVEPFDSGPSSRALRFTERMEAFQAGVYEDTPAAKKLRRELAMDSGDSATLDTEQHHRNRVRAEHQAVKDGELDKVFVLEADAHEIHLEHDTIFVTSPTFLELPAEVRQAYHQHMEQHQQLLSAQFDDFSQQQAQVGPNPKGPPAEVHRAPSPADGGHGLVDQAEMAADQGGMPDTAQGAAEEAQQVVGQP